jgi:hypothetical protein
VAFQQEPTRTPVGIGNIVVHLKDAAATEEQAAYQSAHFEVKVVLSDGTIVHRTGDLAPHITPAQRQGLMDFMAALRAQAEEEILL